MGGVGRVGLGQPAVLCRILDTYKTPAL